MKRARIAATLGICSMSVIALASIGDDFKEASSRDGCEAIPYSSDQSSCKSASSEVEDWCKNSSRRWSCDDLDPSGLMKNIENVNSKINDLKKEKDDLENKRNNSSDDDERKEYEKKVDEKKAQIEELQKKIDAWTKQLADEKYMARDRQAIGERCVENRIKVQKIFAYVKDKVHRENDPDAKQYSSKLVDKYTAAERGHQEAIDITNRGIEKCKGMR